MEYYAEFFTKMIQIGWLQSFWILLPSIGTVAAFGFFGYSHKNESIKSILCIAAVIAGIIFVPIDFYYKADAKNKETRYEQIVEIDRINLDSDVIVDRLRKIIDSEATNANEDKSELVQLYAQLGAVKKFVQLHLGDINLPINKKLSTIESNLNTQYEKIVNDVPDNLKEFKDTLSEMKATVDENKIFIEQIKTIIEQQTLSGDINEHDQDLGNYESKEQTGTEIENSPSKHESLVVVEEPDLFKIENYKNVLEKLNVLQNTTSRRQSIDRAYIEYANCLRQRGVLETSTKKCDSQLDTKLDIAKSLESRNVAFDEITKAELSIDKLKQLLDTVTHEVGYITQWHENYETYLVCLRKRNIIVDRRKKCDDLFFNTSNQMFKDLEESKPINKPNGEITKET